jgi:hypothetical protein
MFALGHERTSRQVRVMSVIPPKADIRQRGLHVRSVPIADIRRCGSRRALRLVAGAALSANLRYDVVLGTFYGFPRWPAVNQGLLLVNIR